MAQSQSQRSYDLSVPEELLSYLENTPFSSTRIEKLSGGVTNYVFRLYLDRAHDGPRERENMGAHTSTVILKHSKPWVASNRAFSLDIQRQKVEATALKAMGILLPEESLVTVPKLLYHDEKQHVLIMEDAGIDSKNLKDLLREQPLSSGEASKIGEALGGFLATVHIQGSLDANLMEYVSTNEEAKKVYAWISYGRVIQELRTLDPDTTFRAHDEGQTGFLTGSHLQEYIKDIEDIVSTATKDILAAESVFTMGDFWTANVIVNQDTTGRIRKAFVVDWEIARPGLPYLDYAQFAAELHTLRRFYPKADACVEEILEAYAKAYRQKWRVDTEFVRGAAVHVGAHPAAITSMARWQPKEKIPVVVMEGVEYMLRGIRDDRWLENTIVRYLL